MFQKISLLVLLFYTFFSYEQDYHFKVYSLEDGLSRAGVNDVLQDQNGFLWIATDGGGLCRFNGLNFESFRKNEGLPTENVRNIFQDNLGTLWFGTDEGLVYHQGNKFKQIEEKDGLTDNLIRCITSDQQNNIWAGTNRGISIIDTNLQCLSFKDKFGLNLPDKKIRSLLSIGDSMWIGSDKGLFLFYKNALTPIELNKSINETILSLYFDTVNSNLWIGTENGLFELTSSQKINFWGESNGFEQTRIRSITQDNFNNIWLATNTGIAIFDGINFRYLNEENGLNEIRVRSLSKDNFGNIWIGTFFNGLLRFNHRDFVSFNTHHGLPSGQILSIAQHDRNTVSVGTTNGLVFLESSDHENFHVKQNNEIFNEWRAVTKIYRSGVKTYYATYQGLYVFENGKISPIIKENYVQEILEVNDEIWLGTSNGLIILRESKIEGEYEITEITESDGLAGSDVSCIKISEDQSIWVSFLDGGISIIKDYQITNPKLPEKMNEVLTMTFSNRKIWFGTKGNGIFYGNKKGDQLNLKQLSIKEQLSSNYIYSLLPIDNKLWVGHELGLDLILIDNQLDTAIVLNSYGPERGFSGLQNTLNTAFMDQDSNLWFGTVNGLHLLRHHDFIAFGKGKSSISYIQKILVNNQEVKWNQSEFCDGVEGPYDIPKTLNLPYDQNNLSIDFYGLNLVSPEKIKYQWRLQGFEENWNPPTDKRFVNYTNLPPGDYTFQLKSSDEHGIFNKEVLNYTFQIQKPFWENWSFRLAAILLAFLITWGIIRWRTNKLRQKQRLLEVEIQERTKEITRQNSELAAQKQKIERSHQELSAKNQEITDSILYSRRIQNSLLPSREKLTSLLDNGFVFYKPKDIISGDFYYIEASKHVSNKIYFAVADCTGHGVPGAMVSVIGTRALNASISGKKELSTSQILDQTNAIVKAAFTDQESGKIIKDGMDIAFCSLIKDEDSIALEFSGANNPVYIIRKSTAHLRVNEVEIKPNLSLNEYHLFQIKGDRQPIGHFDNASEFSHHQILLKKGDRIYMSSDGYADQFGGDQGKKLKYKNFKFALLEIQNYEIAEQRELLKNHFSDWKGNFDQVDDICVMGIEIK